MKNKIIILNTDEYITELFIKGLIDETTMNDNLGNLKAVIKKRRRKSIGILNDY